MRADFVDQPFSQLFYERLRPLISDAQVCKITVASAWVRIGGISLLQEDLASASSRLPSGSVRGLFGVDLGGTTREGLDAAISAFQQVRVFHSTGSPTRTFHPKVYIFESDEHATVFAGSGNLTGGGLATNFEAVSVVEVDKSVQGDAEFLAKVCTWFESFWDHPDAAYGVSSPSDLDALQADPAIWLPNEREAREATGASRRRNLDSGDRATVFGPVTGLISPPRSPAPGTSEAARSSSNGDSESPALEDNSTTIARFEVLAAFIPHDRWHQVGFSKAVVEDFFGLVANGDSIEVQGVKQDGAILAPRTSNLVNPASTNQNHRIELREPDGRDDPKPERGIVIALDRRPAAFRYMHLRPGDKGYAEIANKIASGQAFGPSRKAETKRIRMSYQELKEAWPGDCPLKP